MSQGWNNYSKSNYLNPKEINSGNISNYQRMLAETDPRIANPYEFTQGSKASPKVIKNPNPSLRTILSRNIGATGKGISSGLKAAGGASSKLAGRVSPGLGAGLTGYDAFRSYQIADEMEKINQIQPNSFPKEAIDFYRNKGRAIATGAGVGAGTGGVLGAGAFSVPGALIGTGIGGGLAGLGYEFAQRNNPYANYKISPEQYELLRKDKKGKPSGSNSDSGSSTGVGSKGARGIGGQPTTQAQALALAQQLGGNTPTANQQSADAQQVNINAINDYVSKLQEINQPYIESLQKFADNYGDLYNQNQLYNRRMRDLSAITGSPLWYQSAKDYNPLEVEATKIDLQKKIQDAQAGDLNAINEIMGNLAMAQEMGLSPEAAFANKNLLTAMTMRDRNLTNREIAQLNNAAKIQIALQNAQNRLAVQNLRNQGGMTNALIYAGQYGQPAVGLNQQGLPSNVPASYDAMLQAAHNKNNR